MRILAALGIAISVSGAASAQDFYAGVGVEYAYPHSGDSQTAVPILGGVTFGGPTLRYGIEAEGSVPLLGNQDYNAARLRLIALYDFGNFDALLAGGWTRYDFSAHDEDDGTHLALGFQRDLSERYTLRGEIIRDFMDDSFTAAVTTTRFAVVYSF